MAREKAGASRVRTACQQPNAAKAGIQALTCSSFNKNTFQTFSRLQGKRGKKNHRVEEITKQNKQKNTLKNPKHCAEIAFPFQVTEQLFCKTGKTLSVPLIQALNQENNAPVLLQEHPHLSAAMRKEDRWRKGVWEVAGSASHPKSEARGQTWLLPRSGEHLFAR